MVKNKVPPPPTGQYALELRRYFFMECDPIAVSDLVVCLAAGVPLPVQRIPTCLLPHVVLLATIGLRAYNQQIVDDYVALLERLEDLVRHKTERDVLALAMDDNYRPEPWPWHPQGYLAHFISQRGPRAEYFLANHPEAQYMLAVYEGLINAEITELFQGTKGEKAA